MSAVDDILSQVPVQQLAQQLGTSPDQAQQVAQQAITQLMGGMAQNSNDPQGELALAGALGDHAQNNRLLDGGNVDLSQVDQADGEKIVNHVLGAANTSGMQNDMMKTALKILAPLVLAYLARKITSGDYGNVLGQILGGGHAGSQQQTAPQTQSVPQQSFPQQTQQAPAQQSDASGGLVFPMPGEEDGSQQSVQQTQQSAPRQQSGGGVLGQILGSLLGGH